VVAISLIFGILLTFDIAANAQQASPPTLFFFGLIIVLFLATLVMFVISRSVPSGFYLGGIVQLRVSDEVEWNDLQLYLQANNKSTESYLEFKPANSEEHEKLTLQVEVRQPPDKDSKLKTYKFYSRNLPSRIDLFEVIVDVDDLHMTTRATAVIGNKDGEKKFELLM
jgi:hypothetical protein